MNEQQIKIYRIATVHLLVLLILFCGCEPASPLPEKISSETAGFYSVVHPEWAKNLAIYELNIRQFTPAGDFASLHAHLPRLKEMGVGIIWLMPIYPIGELNRKGTAGSPYSVKDYRAVNDDFGTMDDFKALVDAIHAEGMYVIIDWIANHSSWDNQLTIDHPDWYSKDSNDGFIPPVADWSDVIDFNYDVAALQDYMVGSMRFWVETTDIDGFRCDVAGMVPLTFWERARRELDSIKPVFMLAEDEGPAMHRAAFDMTYAWAVHHIMADIARGRKGVVDLVNQLKADASRFPAGSYRMYFTSNHDENSWQGSVYERLGDAAEVFSVFCATVPGMPLIYGGQEAGMDKRLLFFDKDEIEWKPHRMSEIYTRLLHLKRDTPALWNGGSGGDFIRIVGGEVQGIFVYARVTDGATVFVILNLSSKKNGFSLNGDLFSGDFKEIFSGEQTRFMAGKSWDIAPWGYFVYVQ